MVRKLAIPVMLIAVVLLVTAGAGLRASLGPCPKNLVAALDDDATSIHFINADTDEIYTTIPLRSAFTSAAFGPDKKFYVTMTGISQKQDCQLVVVDPVKKEIEKYVDLNYDYCDGIGADKSNHLVFLSSCYEKNRFAVYRYNIKAMKNKVINHLKAPGFITSDLKQGIYISAPHNSTKGLSNIYKYKKGVLKPVLRVLPEVPPFEVWRYKNNLIGINSGGYSGLKKPHRYDKKLKIIDLKKRKIIKAYNTEPFPQKACLVNNKYFLTHYDEACRAGKVTVFDISKRKFIKTIPVEWPMSITACNNKVYVIDGYEGSVKVIDVKSLSIKKKIPFNSQIFQLTSFDEKEGIMGRRLPFD